MQAPAREVCWKVRVTGQEAKRQTSKIRAFRSIFIVSESDALPPSWSRRADHKSEAGYVRRDTSAVRVHELSIQGITV